MGSVNLPQVLFFGQKGCSLDFLTCYKLFFCAFLAIWSRLRMHRSRLSSSGLSQSSQTLPKLSLPVSPRTVLGPVGVPLGSFRVPLGSFWASLGFLWDAFGLLWDALGLPLDAFELPSEFGRLCPSTCCIFTSDTIRKTSTRAGGQDDGSYTDSLK